jgi:hypothetical protein
MPHLSYAVQAGIAYGRGGGTVLRSKLSRNYS